MNCFFAACEQRDFPQYKGKPLIVGSPPDQRGVVCACSYEARAFGVHSAMPSRTAKKACPNGIFVPPRMDVYRKESHAIMDILRDCGGGLIEQVSVDEAYLDLSSLSEGEIDSALEAAAVLGQQIKDRITRERQLTSSIGIGANKFLAKLGSDYKKPDGLTVIPERTKVQFLRPLPVETIHGVGRVTAESLHGWGLRTIGDIQDTERDLRLLVGSFAESLKRMSFGEDDRPLDFGSERKSISAENTFLVDTDGRPELKAALKELALDVAKTLSAHQTAAFTVQVKVRYSDFHTLTRQIRLQEPVSSAVDLYRLACYLLARDKLVCRPLRLLGLGVSTFGLPSDQLSLNL